MPYDIIPHNEADDIVHGIEMQCTSRIINLDSNDPGFIEDLETVLSQYCDEVTYSNKVKFIEAYRDTHRDELIPQYYIDTTFYALCKRMMMKRFEEDDAEC